MPAQLWEVSHVAVGHQPCWVGAQRHQPPRTEALGSFALLASQARCWVDGGQRRPCCRPMLGRCAATSTTTL